MTKLLHYNQNEEPLGGLKNVLKAIHTEELNGQNVLDIELVDPDLLKGHRLLYRDKSAKWHEFIVKEVETYRQTAGARQRVFCEASIYELWGDYIHDKRPYNVTATAALMDALEPTRWEVGIVDDLGIGSTNFYHISAKQAIDLILQEWKGELRTRIMVDSSGVVHRYVDILARRGTDSGKRISYRKDLESITRTVYRDEVITALYGYGKGELIDETGGYGRRISFAEINDDVGFVENDEARLAWGRNDPTAPDGKAHVFGVVNFDQCEDPEELLTLTQNRLAELSEPVISYDANVLELGGVNLGDSVRVIDEEFSPALRLEARVIKIVRNLLEENDVKIRLGNYLPDITDRMTETDTYINDMRGKAGIWDRANAFNQDGTLSATYLDGLVAALNSQMNARGGYVYISDEGDGIITYDKPLDQDPTMAIQILGGAFRIANEKLPNGNWDWRSFGDGNGFLADEFIGGILRGGKVKFNLSDGTLLIGDSTTNYSLYWDGSKLNIKGSIILSDGTDLETALDEIETTPGPPGKDGEDAITVHIDSINGYIFKNTAVATTLVVTIIKGDQWIDNSTKLEAEFGASAYLQWSEKKFGELTYEDISLVDERLSDNGFLFTISAADIMTKSTFRCDLRI